MSKRGSEDNETLKEYSISDRKQAVLCRYKGSLYIHLNDHRKSDKISLNVDDFEALVPIVKKLGKQIKKETKKTIAKRKKRSEIDNSDDDSASDDE